MDNFRFSTLEYKRPDLDAYRAKLKDWKAAIEHAESYGALRTLLLEMDRENCELSTQYSIANIRHTLNTRDEFYETEVAYLDDTLPTLGGEEVALSEAIASSPFRPDIEKEFGKQYFVSMDLQKKLFCEANIPLRQQESRLTNEYQKIMATAAKNITKVCLELGGKAPAIVMDDADLELAVKAIVDSRVINSGQVCNCAERVYVQKGLYDQFVNRLGEAMKAVQFGNPAERNDIAMGPLINAAALERVEQKVARAVEEGARVALGGKAVEGKGYYYPPTLLLDVRQEMSIMHEETFGPVLPLVAFDTLEEAIAMANDSDYGLTSSIYTQNLNVAMKAIKGLKFGETYINRENFEAMQGFHAGWRKSGIGGADGKHGLHEYLQTQVVYLQS